MPYSYAVYTGNGATTQYAIPFQYIRKEHVKVLVNFVDTAYTYVNNTTVLLASAPANGARVEVRRFTPANTPLVDFVDGSTLVASDLDTSNLQHLFLEQELDDSLKQTVSIDAATGLPSAGNQRITNVGAPVAANDAATKAYTDAFQSQTANIANAAVTTAKLADANVTEAKLAADAVTTAKILNANVTEAKLATDSVSTAKIVNSAVTTTKVADASITEAKLATDAVTVAKIKDGEITSAKLNPATVVTNAEVAGVSPNDTSFFTTSASDLRYFRQDSSETINSGMGWSGSDSFVATTAAIDARIIDLVDDVGGFVPIANETSFPATNPDINNPDGTGTIISIKEIVTTRTPASGTVTIAGGSGGNVVTITGCGNTVLEAGFGVLVETTATLHTYTFHRLVPKATEVTTVAGISANVTTVATNNANVTAVAGNAANINTVAGSIANVNTVGGSIANVNSVASNLGTVNDFAARYRVAATDPSTSLDTGDLVFNTTVGELRVYNGAAWQGGVTATGNLMSKSGDTMTGALGVTAGTSALPGLFISGDTNTGITSPGADQLALTTGGTARLTIDSAGNVAVSGALTKSGNNVVTVGDTGTVTSTMILGGTIINANVNASAAIAGTKVSPDFGSQNVTTTGTVAGASLVPTNSSVPTNGVYLPVANSVAISTAGSGRLFVDANGSVRINSSIQATDSGGLNIETTGSGSTLTPLALLNRGNTNNTGVSINFRGVSAAGQETDYANIRMLASDTSSRNGAIALFTASGGSVSERLRITSAGLVGVGTSSPRQLLDLPGNLTFAGSQSSPAVINANDGVDNSALAIRAGTTASVLTQIDVNSGWNGSPIGGWIAFRTANTERARFTSTGLGIGTTSPAHQLQLSTDSAGKPSTNTWTIVSDERIKEEIELADLDICYEAIKNIPLKRFKWKDDVYTEQQVRDRHKLGWIAQDVEAVFPKSVGVYELKYNQVFEEIIVPVVEEELDSDGNVITPAQPERIEKGELISEEVIEDCRDLNADQLYAAMYGTIQKLISKVETLEAEVAALKAQ